MGNTKSSLMAKVARLNGFLVDERKKGEDKEELQDALARACRGLSEAQCQLEMVTHKSIEAYKKSEKCVDAKRDYAITFYYINKDEVRAKVMIKYLALQLICLDERSYEEDDAEAPEAPTDSLDDLPPTT